MLFPPLPLPTPTPLIAPPSQIHSLFFYNYCLTYIQLEVFSCLTLRFLLDDLWLLGGSIITSCDVTSFKLYFFIFNFRWHSLTGH